MKPEFSEAIKLKDGIFFNIPYHQTRIDRTLARFGGNDIDLAAALSSIPEYAREGVFKCRVVYTDHIESIEFIPYSFRKISTVRLTEADDIEYSYKYTDRTRLKELLEQSGCDDIIIIKNGLVTDASSSNLVFESPEGVFTPDSCLLPGTKRQMLINEGIIAERRIHATDIQNYDRIRFINAMIDLEDNIGISTKRLN